jgi:hypothetical protein
MTMQVLLQYKELFPGECRPSIEELLDGIGRDLIFEIGSFFLSREHTSKEYENCFNTIENFFSSENLEFKKIVLKKTKILHREMSKGERNSTLIIINHIASLRLFDYGLSSKKSETNISRAEVEIRIFNAYLVINELIVERDNSVIDSVDNIQMPLKHSAQTMSVLFPTHDIVNVNVFEILMCQFIKSSYFFEFFEGIKACRPILEAFYNHYGIANWKEFLMKMLGFSKIMLSEKLSQAITFEVEKGPLYESDCRFLRAISLGKSIEENDDFINIRSNPIYEIKQGVFRVIYRPFFFEVIYRSLYFRLNALNETLPDSQKVKGFRAFYCDNFSEKTLMINLLTEMYGKRFITISGEESRPILKMCEPDFYIRNGKKIFLFESKDFNFSVSVKQSGDWRKYENQLKKRFLGFEDHGKLKRGAILQLLENIDRILNGLFKPDRKLKNNHVSIYPIILVHYRLFSIPGLNSYVKEWFSSEIRLRTEKNPALDYSKVRAPVIIDIDTLIFMKDLIESKKLILEDILDKYIHYTDRDLSRKFGDLEEVKLEFEKANFSFKQYLIDQSRLNKWNLKPKLFRESALKIIA